MKRFQVFASALVAFLVVIAAPSAQAVEVYSDENTTVHVNALVRNHLIVQNANTALDQVGNSVVASRLVGKVDYAGIGSGLVQYDGVLGLVDAWMQVRTEHVGVRAGRMRTRVSREFLNGIGTLPTLNRPEFFPLAAPRRAGLKVFAEFPAGPLKIDAEVGTYNPRGMLNIGVDDGQILVGRFELTIKPIHLSWHAAYAQHAFSSNIDPDTLAAVYPNDQQVDTALRFDNGSTVALLEGWTSMDGPNDTTPFGIYGRVSHILPVGEMAVEPAVSYEYFDYDDGNDLHRATVNGNWLFVGHKLLAGIGYGITARPADDTIGHTGVIRMQAGF